MNRELRYKYHSSAIKSWIDQVPRDMTNSKFLNQIEKNLNAVFEATQVSVSEVTLVAILDRVLYNSAEQYPLLKCVKLVGTSLIFSEITSNDKALKQALLSQSFQVFQARARLCCCSKAFTEERSRIMKKASFLLSKLQLKNCAFRPQQWALISRRSSIKEQ